MNFTRGYVSLADGAADVKPGKGEPVVYTASTAGQKRDGMDLDPTRWLVENYRRAGGPWLWAHDTTNRLPIGKGEPTVEPRRLRMAVTYDPHDEFAVAVESKVRRGYIKSCSVSWDFCQRDGSRISTFGRGARPPAYMVRDAWMDLTEGSNVPVGMDPDALVTERSMRYLRHLGVIDADTWRDYDDPYSDVTADELIPELVPAVLSEFDRRGIDLRAAVSLSHTRGGLPIHTATTADPDTPWDADAELAGIDDAATLKRAHAWMDYDGDPESRSTYKLPHHHRDGRVNWHALGNAMARLRQADIPDEDVGAVYRHLADHYRAFGETPPGFRSHVGSFTRAAPPPNPPASPELNPQAVSNLLAAFSLSRGAETA